MKAGNIMVELVETMVKHLVDHPEEVEVRETRSRNTLFIKLKVADEDMGKVIGKRGRIAKALRTVLKAASPNGKVVLDIEK